MRQKTRQIFLPGYELGDYIKESLDFLCQHEPTEGYFVGFSGGKDSIVTLRLCHLAGVRHRAFYSCTRIDPPEVMRFIKKEYPQVTWLYPKKSFYLVFARKVAAFCARCVGVATVSKKAPSRHIPLPMRVMGIRAEESVMRKNKPRMDKYNGKQFIVKPIFLLAGMGCVGIYRNAKVTISRPL